MRLFFLEIKRVLKSRMTKILLGLAFLFTGLLIYMPLTFSYGTAYGKDGSRRDIRGLEGVRYEKELQKGIAGPVTTEKVQKAVKDYQACLKEYGAEESYDLPEGVYERRIRPIAPLIKAVKEAYADSKTGMALSAMELEADSVSDFYGKLEERIESLMDMEQEEHPWAQKTAAALFEKVEKPYVFYPGGTTNVLDYEVLLAFLLLMLCALMAAPVFSSDYQTGADDILRCTRHGRGRLGMVKTLAALSISGGTAFLCMGMYILFSNLLYGWEWTKTSMQMLYSVVSLPNLTAGELELCVAACTVLAVLASVGLMLFLSSRIASSMVTLGVGSFLLLLPTIAAFFLPGELGNILGCILPSSGVSLQGSILYALADFQFLHLGGISFWTPWVIVVFAALEVLAFSGAAVWSYTKYKRQ